VVCDRYIEMIIGGADGAPDRTRRDGHDSSGTGFTEVTAL
jgi:hypothetical protein